MSLRMRSWYVSTATDFEVKRLRVNVPVGCVCFKMPPVDNLGTVVQSLL